MHDVAPCTFISVALPSPQSIQVVKVLLLYLPCGQLEHTSTSASLENAFPAGQYTQDVALQLAAYCPFGHLLHIHCSSRPKQQLWRSAPTFKFSAQVTHDVAPSFFVNVPVSQSIHDEFPGISLYLPVSHAMQLSDL